MNPKARVFEGMSALVIGLGRSGQATLDIVGQQGALVWATDESLPVLEHHRVAFEARGIGLVMPEAIVEEAGRFDVAILSPGIPQTSSVVQALRRAGVEVISEIEAAYRIACAPIIAITGTKGKSTTTMLTGALLKQAGLETYIGGNIGNALIAETALAGAAAWVVAELSSFQLETIHRFRPQVAALLNLSPDHLDRYASMSEYAAAKSRIYMNQTPSDIAIGNLDDPGVVQLMRAPATQPPGLVRWFAWEAHPEASVFVRQERVCWRPSVDNAAAIVEIMPVHEIQLVGRHNVENVLASLLLCLSIGCEPECLREGIRAFRPLSHRLEPIAEIDGVRYINDSKGTNPGAVMAALSSFAVPRILIAGGKKKGTDFSEMGQAIAEHARAAILLGEAAADIAATIAHIPVYRADSMEDAVEQARRLAQPGDVVLLSPGCASFDMFGSAEARGEAFVAAVRAREQVQP